MIIEVGDIIKVMHLHKSQLQNGYSLPDTFNFKIGDKFKVEEISKNNINRDDIISFELNNVKYKILADYVKYSGIFKNIHVEEKINYLLENIK